MPSEQTTQVPQTATQPQYRQLSLPLQFTPNRYLQLEMFRDARLRNWMTSMSS